MGLIKLRIAFLNSHTDSVFLISSLILTHPLAVYGNKDDSNILVLAESFSAILVYWSRLNVSCTKVI